METVTLLAMIEGSRKYGKVRVRIDNLPPFLVRFDGIETIEGRIKSELSMSFDISPDHIKIKIKE